MGFEYWQLPLASAGISLLLCLLLSPVARRTGLLDHPSERKVHSNTVPLVGGAAIFLAMSGVIMAATPYGLEALPLFAACAMMLIIGMIDDVRELSAFIRFVFQILACCIMVFVSDVLLTDFGKLMWNGVLYLGFMSVPITIFSALGVINAFNMMDGMDGLSSMIFIVASTAMAWLALMAGQVANATILIIAAGATLGFFVLNARLPWNKSARVFLGDSGSGFVGLLLAWQFIDLGNGADRAFAPMTAVWLLGIPLLDTTLLMVRRKLQGGSPFDADQHHLHHAFLRAGFSVRQTLLIITGMVLCTTTIGLAGQILAWPEYLMFYAYIAFGLVYYHTMTRCWRDHRFLGRDVARNNI
jgi:UDP-GlcNAc:undecaprenyl-phosphate GlcNAc-1-phosphate transferase